MLGAVEVEGEGHAAGEVEEVDAEAGQVQSQHDPLLRVRIRPQAKDEHHHVHRERGEQRRDHVGVRQLEGAVDACAWSNAQLVGEPSQGCVTRFCSSG